MTWHLYLTFFVTLFLSIGCRFQSELSDDDASQDQDSEKRTTRQVVLQPKQPSSKQPDGFQVCEGPYGFEQSIYFCLEKNQSQYVTSCDLGTCLEVPVQVTYMLPDDLGQGHMAIVEAFDNPFFQGNPIAQTMMTGFDASGPGKNVRDHLFLPVGDYYFRGYLARRDNPPVPYQYGDMELVSQEPVGLYGALSDVTKVHVSDEDQNFVTIFLDQLFQDPEKIEPTEAYVRTIIHAESDRPITLGKKVWIELHEQEDFSFHPRYRFSLSTDALLVAGSKYKAERLSSELDIGDYFVFAYIDESGNDFYDVGEPWQVYKRHGELGLIHVEQDKTVTVELHLTSDEGAPLY